MISKINYSNVARITNLRAWGVRYASNEKLSEKQVQFLDEYLFTEDDFRFLNNKGFDVFLIEHNDFKHSAEYWFSVFIADVLAKGILNSRNRIPGNEEALFFIQDEETVVKEINALNLYRKLNFEEREFLMKLLFDCEVNQATRSHSLKAIPIEVVSIMLDKENANEFSGPYTLDLIKQIQSKILLTK